MRILITGSHGQVGRELSNTLKAKGIETAAITHNDLDITRLKSVQKAFADISPTLVANCAAYTAVDRAESDQEQAFAVNRDGPAHLADVCAVTRTPLIHISTDYVFDGTKKTPYVETDMVCPINIYGKSKAAGEVAIRERLDRHIILRTSWVFSAHGSNFVKTMLRLGKERDAITIVDDQIGCPTSAASIARAITCIIERYNEMDSLPWGTYHYCDQPATSWYRFAEAIFVLLREEYWEHFKLQHLDAVTTAQYPTPAKRALYSVLNCEKFKRTFDIRMGNWEDGLRDAFLLLIK